MTATIPLNTLIKNVTSVIEATTTAPDKGTPVIDEMNYHIMGPLMYLNWQFEEDVQADAVNFTVAMATSICTATAHGLRTGMKVQLTTTDTLPAGLAVETDYYVIKINANTFYLASSLLNANAGVKITLAPAGDGGTGTHTCTQVDPAATAGDGTYLIELPDSYEVDSSFVSIGTGTHSNVVGVCTVIDSAETAVDLQGYVTAYDSTHLAMVVNKAFVGSSALGLAASDAPTKYSLQAIIPIKNRNYEW